MSAVVVLLVVVFGVVMLRRRVRKAELAGRNSERPVYSVDPPRRRIGARKDERL